MAEKIMTPAEYYKKISKEDKDAIINLGDRKGFDFVPTGSWVMNFLIGDGNNTNSPGGFPRGHVVEVFGDESSGKTTMALSACKQAQDMGGVPVFVDFERTFHKQYAINMGLDLSPEKFILMEPKYFEHGARMIKDVLMTKPPIIVVDSVSAMIPKQFLEGQVDESGRIGLQAQLMSAYLAHITKYLQPSNTCLLFTNQLRSVIKQSKWDTGPEEETSGGRAIRFYSSLRIKMKKGMVERVSAKNIITGKKEKEPVSVIVKITVVKNKIDKPYRTGPVYIRFGRGFDNIMSLIEFGINNGVIKASGPYYKFEKEGEQLFNLSGKEAVRDFLEKNDKVHSKLQEELKKTMIEDQQAAEDYAEEQESTEDDVEALLGNISESFVEKKSEEKTGKRKKSDD